VGSNEDEDRSTSAGLGRICLRFGDHDVDLAEGETLIGRSPKCEIVLDDPLVSRSHARLVVNRGAVTIEDLKSANGVLVNGETLVRARVLQSGDRIVIGQQGFQLVVGAKDSTSSPERRTARTLSNLRDFSVTETERSEATRKGDALELLGGVADKVLALGRGDEAERILSSYLRNLLQNARVGGELEPHVAEKAATYAVRIAEVTGKGTWVDYTFELYTIAKRPLPGPVVERLYASLRKISSPSIGVFRQYLSALRSVESSLGPSDRFLVRRIEGLESLAVLK
jgi:pSer/pThr/pTyr-binding forkhead associated (FHA) protein